MIIKLCKLMFLTFIGTIYITLSGCTDASEQAYLALTGEVVEKPDLEQKSFNMIVTSAGIKTAEIKSGYMEHFISKKNYYLTDTVTADFYNKEGLHASRLTSLHAEISEIDDLFKAWGNVVVVSDSGITVITDTLYWNNKTEQIYTNDFVTIVSGLDTLYGIGFISDKYIKNYTIRQTSGVTYRNIGKSK